VYAKCKKIHDLGCHMASEQKSPLTQKRIVLAALAVADRDGIHSISMRTLATALDAGTMSLYNHIRNKDELIDAMVEDIAATIERPEPGADWKQGVRQIAVSTRTVLHRHPWAVEVWSARIPGPQRWTLMEAILDQLASAGLPGDLTDLAFHAVLNHILGHTRQELAAASSNPGTHVQDLAAKLDAERFPEVIDHLRYHAEDHPTHDSFLFVLDLILDGLDGLARRNGTGTAH
jgi:AcrR family transcriptional regulator